MASMRANDLAALAELMQSGKVTPQVDRRYPLGQIKEAITYLETGRARAKVVLTME
jgi:NADPH:quinone reductase-like Zn-dependent oxidoreductase